MSAKTVHEVFDMTRKDFIYDEVLKKYFPKKEIRDEFHNHLWLQFFENSGSTVNAHNNKYFKYYFIAAVKNQVISNSSNWHNTFRKPQFELREELPEETEEFNHFQDEEEEREKEIKKNKIALVNDALNHFLRLDPNFKVSRDMFKAHYEDGLSIRQISKKFFGTPPTSCYEYIKNAEALIQHYIRKHGHKYDLDENV